MKIVSAGLLLILAPVFMMAQAAQVSDTKALELIFSASCVLPEHSPAEVKARTYSLHRYAFTDEANVARMLSLHCAAYNREIAQYNAEVEADLQRAIVAKADYTPPLPDKILAKIRAIVNGTAAVLQSRYPGEWDGFMAKVQAEKEYMASLEEKPMLDGTGHAMSHNHINAQSGFDQSPNEYGYVGYSQFGTDGRTGWFKVQVVGTSSNSYFCTWDAYHQQWQPPPCPAVYHVPSISIQTSGGWPNADIENINSAGGNYSPAAYMNFSAQNNPALWNFDMFDLAGTGSGGPILKAKAQLTIACTVAGIILGWPVDYQITNAYTKGYVFPNAPPWPAACPATPWCTPQTTPPFYNFNKLVPLTISACSNPYWDGYEIYVSHAHQPWRDTGVGYAEATPDPNRKTCDTAAKMPVP